VAKSLRVEAVTDALHQPRMIDEKHGVFGGNRIDGDRPSAGRKLRLSTVCSNSDLTPVKLIPWTCQRIVN
jgi:hypothetical protein